MMTTSTDRRRALPTLDWTESWPSCAPRLITSPVNSPTLAITSPVSAFHAHGRHSRARVRGGSAHFTTLPSRSHGIQSP